MSNHYEYFDPHLEMPCFQTANGLATLAQNKHYIYPDNIGQNVFGRSDAWSYPSSKTFQPQLNHYATQASYPPPRNFPSLQQFMNAKENHHPTYERAPYLQPHQFIEPCQQSQMMKLNDGNCSFDGQLPLGRQQVHPFGQQQAIYNGNEFCDMRVPQYKELYHEQLSEHVDQWPSLPAPMKQTRTPVSHDSANQTSSNEYDLHSNSYDQELMADWRKAPGAERQNNVPTSKLQASKVLDSKLSPNLFNAAENSCPPSIETIARSAVPLSGFAAEFIWDLVHSGSPLSRVVKSQSDFNLMNNALFTTNNFQSYPQKNVHVEPLTPTMNEIPLQPCYLQESDINNFCLLNSSGLNDFPVSKCRASDFLPDDEFRRFCYATIAQTLASPSALMLALYYASKVPRSGGPVWESIKVAPYRLLVVGMQLADKCLSDNTFTNNTWHEVTGVPLKVLNAAELWAFSARSYSIHVPDDDWRYWLQSLYSAQVKKDKSRMAFTLTLDDWIDGRTEKGVAAASCMEILREFERHQSKISLAINGCFSPELPASQSSELQYHQSFSEPFDMDADGPLRPFEGQTGMAIPSSYRNSTPAMNSAALFNLPIPIAVPCFDRANWMQNNHSSWKSAIV